MLANPLKKIYTSSSSLPAEATLYLAESLLSKEVQSISDGEAEATLYLAESLLRLRKHKKVSALMRLSPESREFILSSDVPEASGSRNKFLLYP